MILQPHSKLGQDIIPQGVTELQDLGDWGQSERFRGSWDPQDVSIPEPQEGAEPLDPLQEAGKSRAATPAWVSPPAQPCLRTPLRGCVTGPGIPSRNGWWGGCALGTPTETRLCCVEARLSMHPRSSPGPRCPRHTGGGPAP